MEMRPIFHFTERRIEAHICICFVAYKLYKELERRVKNMNLTMSVDKVIETAKTIVTIKMRLPNGGLYTRMLFNTPAQKEIRPLIEGIEVQAD